MHEVLAPAESQLVEQDGQHLEVVVLLVAYHVDHLVDRVVLETEFGGADVLSHIHGGAVGTEQELLVETFCLKVGPNRSVISAVEQAFLQTFHHLLLAFKVGVGLIIYLVERNAHALVGLVESGIDPFVHRLPQAAYLGVVVLPFHEHVVGFLDERCFLLGFLLGAFLVHAFAHVLAGKLIAFGLVVLVELHVEVADKVVTFLAGALWSGAVAPFLPCQHGLADVDAAVVHDVGLHHLVAVGFHNACQRGAEQVVAHVAQVERFVGVRRGILNHHQRTLLRRCHKAELLFTVDFVEQANPGTGAHHQVQETFHHVEVSHHIGGVLLQVGTQLGTHVFWLLTCRLHEWKDHNGKVSLKFFLGFLKLNLLLLHFCAIEAFDALLYGIHDFLFYCHDVLMQEMMNRHQIFAKLRLFSHTAKKTRQGGPKIM